MGGSAVQGGRGYTISVVLLAWTLLAGGGGGCGHAGVSAGVRPVQDGTSAAVAEVGGDLPATADGGTPQPGDSGEVGAPDAAGAAEAIHVDAVAPPGGDGSASRPLQTLEEALRLWRTLPGPPRRIQVALGRYSLPAALTLERELTIAGAGARQTVIDRVSPGEEGPAAEARVAIDGAGPLTLQQLGWRIAVQLKVARLTLTGLAWRGDGVQLGIEGASLAELSDAAFAGSAGLRLHGCQQVRLSTATFEGPGDRLQLVEVGQAELGGITMRGTSGPALLLDGCGQVVLDGLTVEQVGRNPDDADHGGDALVVDNGELRGSGIAIRDVADRALVLSGSRAVLAGPVLSRASRGLLMAFAGSAVEVDGAELAGASVLAYASGAALRIRHGVLRSGAVAALMVGPQGTAELEDSEVLDCPQGHISLIGEGAGGTIRGNVLRRAETAACIAVSGTNAAVQIVDNTIEGCAGGGIDALTVNGLTVLDNRVSAIRPDPLFADVANGISLVDSTGTIQGNRVHDIAGTGIALLRSSGQVRDNVVGPVSGAGISVVDPAALAALVEGNEITSAWGAGIIVLGSRAEVRGNTVAESRYDPASALGDGVAFGSGATVAVHGNTLARNTANGVLFLDGAAGSVEGNRLEGNGYYGIREFCLEGMRPDQVTVGENSFAGNGLGEVLLCAP